jgi:TfoX/Sxy family transcriptional regulator of competence genes
MASDQDFITFVCDQLHAAGQISYRKMFGEYALYRAGKVVALVCDNQLFVKPTAGGRKFIGSPMEAPPYPGAKPHFLIADELDNAEWLSQLVVITDRELPAAKPKQAAKKK